MFYILLILFFLWLFISRKALPRLSVRDYTPIIQGLNSTEKDIVKNFAKHDVGIEQCKVIYFKYLRLIGSRGSLEMNFLSEVFSVSPDLSLKARLRKQIIGILHNP